MNQAFKPVSALWCDSQEWSGVHPVVLQFPEALTELEVNHALQAEPEALGIEDKYSLNTQNKYYILNKISENLIGQPNSE